MTQTPLSDKKYEEWIIPPPKKEKGTAGVYKKRRKKILTRSKWTVKETPQPPFAHKWTFGFNPEVPIVNLTTECRRAIAFGADNFVFIYNYENHKLKTLLGHVNEVVYLAVERQGTFLASCDNGEESSIIIWDTYNFVPVRIIYRPNETQHKWLFLSPQGDLVISMEAKLNGNIFHFWSWLHREDEPTVLFDEPDNFEDKVLSLKFHEQNMRFIVVTYRHHVVLIYMEKEHRNIHLPKPKDETEPLGYYNDSTYSITPDLVFTCTSTGHVIVWETIVKEMEHYDIYDAAVKECVHQIPLQSCSIEVIQCLDNYIYTLNAKGIISIYTSNLCLLRHLPNYGLGPIVHIYPNLKIGEENTDKFNTYLKKTMTNEKERKKLIDYLYKFYGHCDKLRGHVDKDKLDELKKTIEEFCSFFIGYMKREKAEELVKEVVFRVLKRIKMVNDKKKTEVMNSMIKRIFDKVKCRLAHVEKRTNEVKEWKKAYNKEKKNRRLLKTLMRKEKRRKEKEKMCAFKRKNAKNMTTKKIENKKLKKEIKEACLVVKKQVKKRPEKETKNKKHWGLQRENKEACLTAKRNVKESGAYKAVKNFKDLKKILLRKPFRKRKLLTRRCEYWKLRMLRKLEKLGKGRRKKRPTDKHIIYLIKKAIKGVEKYKKDKIEGPYGYENKRVVKRKHKIRKKNGMVCCLPHQSRRLCQISRTPGRTSLLSVKNKKESLLRKSRTAGIIWNAKKRQQKRKKARMNRSHHQQRNKHEGCNERIGILRNKKCRKKNMERRAKCQEIKHVLSSDGETQSTTKHERKRVQFNRLGYPLGNIASMNKQNKNVKIKGGEIISRKNNKLTNEGGCHRRECTHFKAGYRPSEENAKETPGSKKRKKKRKKRKKYKIHIKRKCSTKPRKLKRSVSVATYGSQETFVTAKFSGEREQDYWYPPKKVRRKQFTYKEDGLREKLFHSGWDARTEPPIKGEDGPVEVRDFIVITTLGQIAYLNPEKDYPHFLYYSNVERICALAVHPIYKFISMATITGTLYLYDYNKKVLIHQNKIQPLSHMMPKDLVSKLTEELREANFTVKPQCFKEKLVPRSKEITSMLYSPNGDTLVCAMKDGAIILLGPLTLRNKFLEPVEETSNEIYFMKFTPDSLFMFVADAEETIFFFRMSGHPSLITKYKPHDGLIFGFLFCQPSATEYTPYSFGVDRKVNEYDMKNSVTSEALIIKRSAIVESTGVPTAICNCPSNNPFIVLIANDQCKVKIYDLANFRCLRTVQVPELSGSIVFMQVIQVRGQHILSFRDKKWIGFNMMPLDGNPYKWMTGRIAVDPLTLFVPDKDLNYFFTTTKDASFVNMWKMNVMPLFFTQLSDSSKLCSYLSCMPGGIDGDLLENMIDNFYLAQIIHDGIYLKRERQVHNFINACELIDVMRAVGYFPSELEIKNILEELKVMNPDKEHLAKIRIFFDDFLKLFINHRLTKELSEEDLKFSFSVLTQMVGETHFNYLKRENFLNILESMGESMSKLELFTYLKILKGERTTRHDMKLIKDEPEDLFDFLPKRITFQYFYEVLLGCLQPSEYIGQTGDLDCKDVPDGLMSDDTDEEVEQKKEPKPKEEKKVKTKTPDDEKEEMEEKKQEDLEKEDKPKEEAPLKSILKKETKYEDTKKKEEYESESDLDSDRTDDIEKDTNYWLDDGPVNIDALVED